MKHNFKLKERLGALLLAMLFILQAILGLVPVCVTQAAPLTVETWDSDKVVDYGYRFNMKFQPGITTYESFGCDNLDREAFSDNGKSERDTECVRVGADYKAGSAGMRYNNVGKDGNGNIVDVRLILVGVENPVMICALQNRLFRIKAELRLHGKIMKLIQWLAFPKTVSVYLFIL